MPINNDGLRRINLTLILDQGSTEAYADVCNELVIEDFISRETLAGARIEIQGEHDGRE